ncbi:hypothetical protein SCHPADRAFT_474685 [Schizopora paradoxa]|uniref:Uncharacterized protein n=1 Tax=Schizopora paradoxa TaxID=27342 RepID=A0A0H2S378_9AGAM|nr:hypothetical protein SCHPADRAFT_474685 [Schizopora paradoxa]
MNSDHSVIIDIKVSRSSHQLGWMDGPRMDAAQLGIAASLDCPRAMAYLERGSDDVSLSVFVLDMRRDTASSLSMNTSTKTHSPSTTGSALTQLLTPTTRPRSAPFPLRIYFRLECFDPDFSSNQKSDGGLLLNLQSSVNVYVYQCQCQYVPRLSGLRVGGMGPLIAHLFTDY